MNILKSYTEIANHIRIKIIHEGLELEELGIEIEEVTDDTLLFEETGLNLDSIDALDIISSVQRDFGLTFPEVNHDFMIENCASVGLLAKTVQKFCEQKVVL